MKLRNPIRPLRVVERRKTYVPHLLAIGLLWALAMSMEYADETALANERADSMTSQFADCLNGTWRGITPSGEQIACLPAESLKPINRSKS